MTLSDFCDEWMRLYRVWELSGDNEDYLKMKDHQRTCEKCRKTKSCETEDKTCISE